MKPSPASCTTHEARAIQQFYDVFAPHYDNFYELIDYKAWAAMIQRELDNLIPGPRRILEVGCGTGAILYHLLPCNSQFRPVGVDISLGMLQQCQSKFTSNQKPTLVQGDVFSLSFQDHSFEVTLGNFSLLNFYSMPGRRTLLQEVRRVLEHDGIFLTDFLTIHRYHQLLQEAATGKETSYADTQFKIEQIVPPAAEANSPSMPDLTCQDRYVIEKSLILKNRSVHKRLYFFDPQQIEREFAIAGFQIVKITPLVPDISVAAANRLMIVGRKP
jgi:ubiquinone/menaquinone biosynthesis C-methylase UbiE